MKRSDRQLRPRYFMALCITVFLMLFLMVVDGKPADLGADYPSRPIAIVTHNAPGASLDVMCRLISDIMQKEKILRQPLLVVNRVGSGGVVSFGYLLERNGNPHVILASGTGSIIATPLMEKLSYTYKSFVPIANLLFDGSVLVVKSDSPFKTAEDLIAEARKRPKELIQGISSIAGNESQMGQSMQRVKGVQWNSISFAGSDPETLLNVLSGNIHFAFANPSFIMDYVHGGKLRVLLAGTPIRYPQLKDVPTIKEAGMGEPVVSYRGILGPPNMPDYAVRKLESAFKKLMDTSRFKKFLEESMIQPYWLSANEYSKFLDEENERSKLRLTAMGLIKKK
jgi:putative tricarboxylic transport membrane protein